MVQIYVSLIRKGLKTINDVPTVIRSDVAKILGINLEEQEEQEKKKQEPIKN